MLPVAAFGRTGHRSTRLLFGAAALGGMSQQRADATLEFVRDAGINHIDTAASYGDAEDRLRPWLADHRDGVFLATKTGERDGDAARAELERSLERMGVDSVDLIQLHNLVEPDEWERAFAVDGAVAALSTPGTRASHGSSASPDMGCGSPGCTDDHWSASTSTPCCCRTTTPCSTSPSTGWRSRNCSAPVASATSRCRRSSRSHGAGGTTDPRDTSAGTSRSATTPRSPVRSDSCCRTISCSSTRPATRGSCRR